LQHLAWSATTRGDYAAAERTLAAAADVFASLDDDGGLSWCAGTEAFVRLLQGRHTEARELAGGLLPLGRALGDRWGTAACLTIDGFAAAELGQIETGLDQATTAYEEFRSFGDTWGQTMALIAIGAALRGSGRVRKAVRRFEQAVAVADRQHPVPGALAIGALGYCRLDLGDPKAADEAADRALALMTGLDVRPGALVGLRVLKAQALRAQGDLEAATQLLQEARELPEASLVFPRRQALAHLAGTLRDRGQSREALVVAQEAMAVPAEDVRSRVIALRALGTCLADCGDRPAGRFALQQAVALAGSTEMRSELPASEKALAAFG
jgi:tetratricopeptide (TPR) repeat protein